MRGLLGWKDLPREKLLQMFEGGHFAGMDELRANERLFDKVAPMGVNDIMMAAQYRCGSAVQDAMCAGSTELRGRLHTPQCCWRLTPTLSHTDPLTHSPFSTLLSLHRPNSAGMRSRSPSQSPCWCWRATPTTPSPVAT